MKVLLDKINSNPFLKKILTIFLVVFVIIIFLLVIVSCSAKNKVYEYSDIEEELVYLTKNQYEDSEVLPEEGKELTIDANDFINSGKLKSFNEITKDKVSCTGKITIRNNNGYFIYVPYLDCGTAYKSTTLYDELLKNEVTSGKGLYKTNNGYVFKGDNLNNNIVLNGIKYSVISLDENGNIKIIEQIKRTNANWDNHFNVEKNAQVGINEYITNDLNSDIKTEIEKIYNDDTIWPDNSRGYFIPTEYCIGKRSLTDTINDGSIECSVKSDKAPFGLLSLYEYFNASLDKNCVNAETPSCTNYNYLYELGSLWTITADRDTSYKVYKLTMGEVTLSNASNSSVVRIVTHINKDLIVSSGSGSIEDPYIIKAF